MTMTMRELGEEQGEMTEAEIDEIEAEGCGEGEEPGMEGMETVSVEVPASILARCEERADRDETTVADVLFACLVAYSTPFDPATLRRGTK